MKKPKSAAAKALSHPTSVDAEPPRDPDGVYEESGFRLPLPRREMFDAEGQRAFDLVAGRAAGKAR